jgi:hypothetical protein
MPFFDMPNRPLVDDDFAWSTTTAVVCILCPRGPMTREKDADGNP